MKIEDLGYNSFFESNKNQLDASNLPVARVISKSRGVYKIKNANRECLAKITGKQMFTALSQEDYPAVGDWVIFTELGNNRAVINRILPRLTLIKRRHGDKNKLGEKNDTQVIAANIDVAFIVESVDRDYNLNRLERYFAIAKNGGVLPAIILNKVDLLSKDELNYKLAQLKTRFPDIDIISTSSLNDAGFDDLKKYITKGKTYCFLGSSGVGKSSLINKLLNKNIIKTREISSHSDRGKHITTIRQMYFLENGGIVIDNPGIREVGIVDTNQGVDSFFDEITRLAQKCKFADCTHTHEPGCKVIEAVKAGNLDKEKYSNYIIIKKETEYYEMNDFEKRDKDRQFGKFLKKAKKELRDFGREK